MATCSPCLSSDKSDPLNCAKWDLTKQPKTDCLVNNYQQEQLQIAGAMINIHKLLGVHEQTLLTDSTGSGVAISSGDYPGTTATNAFDVFNTKWVSLQVGQSVLSKSYIGYDFGPIRLANGRERYAVAANERRMITTLKIKQGQFRATKIRVERSDNNVDWYGVVVATLPDDTNLNTIHIKQSVSSRYWRIRPLMFNGGSCDGWEVYSIELAEYASTELQNIQDFILLENRDRSYLNPAIGIKGQYDLQTAITDLTRFGIELTNISYQIRLNFNSCVSMLGRPIVIGDIIELPSEAQYRPDMTIVKKYLEVSDVTWDSASYTPGWVPTTLLITAKPAMASQETQDIFGSMTALMDDVGVLDNNDGNSAVWQDFTGITQQIRSESKTDVPERGSDLENSSRVLYDEEIQLAESAGFLHVRNLTPVLGQLSTESALPPNGLPYTEGTTYPINPNNGDYHRLIYVGLSSDIPAHLYRWSAAKGRWIFLEQDKRALFDADKPVLDEYRTFNTKSDIRDLK
jgi:hypothetical protein